MHLRSRPYESNSIRSSKTRLARILRRAGKSARVTRRGRPYDRPAAYAEPGQRPNGSDRSASSAGSHAPKMIDCGVCSIRPWMSGDEVSLRRHADDREIWLNLRDRFPHPYTEHDARRWIEVASTADPLTNFAIEVGGEAVGGIGLVLHDDIERVSAEIGYWSGRTYWGRGIMTAAVRGLTRYGFQNFDLTRIYAVPFARNVASCRVLEKAGYVREGMMRRSAVKDGVVLDQILYAATDEEYRAG